MKHPNFFVYRPRPERTLPLIVHLPHVGAWMPGPARDTFVATEQEVEALMDAMFDHGASQVFWPALHYGATLFVNKTARIVYDPERFEDDEQEPMSRHGLGMVYTRLLDGRPLRRPDPHGRDRREIIQRLHRPYVKEFEDLVDEYLERFGEVWILDGHTYPDHPLPFEDPTAERPVVCLGYESQQRAQPEAVRWFHYFEEFFDPFRTRPDTRSVLPNTPFAGSYVPPRHRDDPRVHSLMIELNRSSLRMLSGEVCPAGPCVEEVMKRFLGWQASFIARRLGIERRPWPKPLAAGAAVMQTCRESLGARSRVGDLIDGLRCHIDFVDAFLAGVDHHHIEDCWLARVEVPEPTLRRTGDAPHYAMIDKWTCMARWHGRIEVEILDAPEVVYHGCESFDEEVDWSRRHESREWTAWTLKSLRDAGVLDEDGNFNL